MIWWACRCRENELVFTRDLGTGSLLSTFSVGRTGVMGGWGGVEKRGGGREERSMTSLRLAPGSLWGLPGPLQSTPSSPLTPADFFPSSFKSILFFFLFFSLFIYLENFLLSFRAGLFHSSCFLFLSWRRAFCFFLAFSGFSPSALACLCFLGGKLASVVC